MDGFFAYIRGEMRRLFSIGIWALSLLMAGGATRSLAQVSHGGSPLPLAHTRATDAEGLYVEMPPLDQGEIARLDSLERGDTWRGYRFAHKFMTDLNPTNSGVRFTLADGTKVWRLGIHSPGARSINLLLSEYELPEGASLFVYDADQRQVRGAFNHLNNSEEGILPLAPIRGDRLIVEYQEPANATFAGRIRISEVNHGYRDFWRIEPDDDTSVIEDIPALACLGDTSGDYARLGRSVALLVVDGTISCTGVLVNNTDGDGTPYLLTASHCLNNSFRIENPDYERIAGSVICFYNYDSPFCEPVTRGTEEMTTASAHCRAVYERADIALLETRETPPVYYRPYLAGWNAGEAGEAPFACLHHPKHSPKRISLADETPERITFSVPGVTFDTDAHWWVKRWSAGYTAEGSSGSPLFNAAGEVIGVLSGGQSTANNPGNDYYSAVASGWNTGGEAGSRLADWLNPAADGALRCPGLDPYAEAPCLRLSNVFDSGRQEEAACDAFPGETAVPLFGHPGRATEYAEGYLAPAAATLYGTYIVTPAAGAAYTDMEVEVTVYAGDANGPATLLHTERFRPTYTDQSLIDDQEFVQIEKSLDRPQESFVRFAEPVSVSGRFFVGYRLVDIPEGTRFAAYNLPKGATTANTAYVHDTDGWKPASAYAPAGFATSLLIDPVIQYGSLTANERIAPDFHPLIHVGPGKGQVRVVLPDGEAGAAYTLVSARGEVVASGSFAGPEATIQPGRQVAGIYLLTLTSRGKSHTQKILLSP